MRTRRVTVALLGILLAGCQEKRTQIMLGIATDFDAPTPLRSVRLQVYNLDRGDQAPAIENLWPITGTPNQPFELPGSFGLHSEDTSSLPRMRIVLSGLGRNDTPLLTRTAVVKLVREQTLFMRMGLVVDCATDAECPAMLTCVESRCREPEIDASTLPAFREVMVNTIGCSAGPTYVNTSTNTPMPMMGSGACAPDEECIEGTCYKRPTGENLARDIEIKGVVQDYAGKPIPDASIAAREGAINGPLLGKIVKSNDQGEFRVLGRLPAGSPEALVYVTQGDYAPQIMPVPIKPAQSLYLLPVVMPRLTLTPMAPGSNTTITASPTVTITVPPTPGARLARHAVVDPVRGPGRLRADGADPNAALQSVGMVYIDLVDAANEVLPTVAARVVIARPPALPAGVPMVMGFRVYRLGVQGLWADAGPPQADETTIQFTTTSVGFWDVNRTIGVACVRGRLRHTGGGCKGARVVAGSQTVGVSGFDSSDAEGGFCVNGAPGVMSTLLVGSSSRAVTFPATAGSCAMPATCADLMDLPIDLLQCEAAPPAALGNAGDPCAGSEACKPGLTCYNKFCVGAGKLRVSLGFTADTDLDLHLRTPLGSEISFATTTADGGELDVDQCSMRSCGTGEHVENIVFRDTLPSGTYQVWVVNFDPRAAADFTIDVAGAVTQKFTGHLTATPNAESMRFSFVVP